MMNSVDMLNATLEELNSRLELLEPISIAVQELFELGPEKMRAIDVYATVAKRADIVLSNRACVLIASVIEAYGGRRVRNRHLKTAFFTGIKLR